MPINKQRQTRLNCLLRLMRENRYPNHPILKKAMSLLDAAGAYAISQKSVQRDVAYLNTNYRGAPAGVAACFAGIGVDVCGLALPQPIEAEGDRE